MLLLSRRLFSWTVVFFAFLASPLFAAAVVPPTGTYTLAVLPDTQKYAESYPEIFMDQTEWILANKDADKHNIAYAFSLGDITDNNVDAHWVNARNAYEVLDGQVPYALAWGNHDYGNSGVSDNRTSLGFQDQYFGMNSPYASQSSIGGFFSGYGETGKTDNSYHTFTMGDQDWMILTMEFGPRDDVVTWANNIIQSHPDHKVIVVTHAYMYNESVRYDYELFHDTDYWDRQTWTPYQYAVASQAGGVNDGQEIYEKMLENNDNVFMVVNGHVLTDGTGYREVLRENGTVLHEMLVNYQFDANGGNGFMRLLEFAPDGSTVNVKSYSPTLDTYDTAADQQFTMAIFDRAVNADQCQAVLTDTPVMYHRLQEHDAAETVVNLGSTGTANDGTYTGSGPLASDFDGTGADYVEVGTMSEMSQWSITSWVRADSLATRQTIITNDRSGWHDDVLFGLGPDSHEDGTTIGHWALSHHDDDTLTETIVECPTIANAGQWYHVSATCDGDVVRLYVDGQLVDESARSGADLDWGAVSNLIGKSYNSSDSYRPFDGTIGEVAVYDQCLSTSDVETQRLAAFNRVVAGNLVVAGATVPSTNTVDGITIPQQSFPGISTGDLNKGDYEIYLGSSTPCYAREGVLLATVTQNLRDGVRGIVEVGLNSYSDGVLSLSTAKAGVSGTTEININASVAWFPFFSGWKGGHVLRDTSNNLVSATGYDMDDTVITEGTTGHFKVDLGVDSSTDGMLFTVGAGNSAKATTTMIDSSGDGWFVDVRDSVGSLVDGPFSFLYIPYDTENLIGGRYDGVLGVNETNFGDFTFTKLQTGQYSLSITGETPETGMLVLGVTGETALESSFITYEAGGDDFLIESHLLSGLAYDDVQFYWAFISFNDPLTLPAEVESIPGDANRDGYVDGSDATILAGYWQQTDATWEMGDFNGDHVVDGSDATILAGYWQQGTPPTAAAVPEPSTILLLLAGLLALPLLRKVKG